MQEPRWVWRFDEDQIGDAERNHASEEIAYIALAEVPDEPLTLDPITTSASVTGSTITFDAVASGGANLEYNWNFGDGTETGFGDFASFDHSYATPGRYVISVTVRDPDNARGDKRSVHSARALAARRECPDS